MSQEELTDLSTEKIEERLQALRRQAQVKEEKATRLAEQRNAALQDREDARRRLKKLRSEKEAAVRERESQAFLPGSQGTATATKAAQRVEELEQEIEETEGAYEDLHEAWEAAKGELAKKRRETMPLLLELARRRVEEEVDAYEAIAAAVLDEYEAALAARAARGETIQEVRRTASRAKPAEGDPRIHSRQRQEAKGYLREVLRDVSPEASLGFLLVDLMNWTRRGSSPCGNLWDDREVERLDGSTEYADPIPAANDTLHRLRLGSLPVNVNL